MKLRSMTFLSLLIIFSIAVAHANADSKVENEVKTPISSKNLDEEYYDDLVTDFKKAGFTDVVVKKDEDLIFADKEQAGQRYAIPSAFGAYARYIKEEKRWNC